MFGYGENSLKVEPLTGTKKGDRLKNPIWFYLAPLFLRVETHRQTHTQWVLMSNQFSFLCLLSRVRAGIHDNLRHFLSSPPVSSSRCHVNKARFGPSKGSARQLPAGGDRAERRRERQTGRIDRKRDKGELCGGAEQGNGKYA